MLRFAKLPRNRAVIGALLLLLNGSGCGLTDVTNPAVIEDQQLNNASGAELLRATALAAFYTRWGRNALDAGVYTDEFSEYITPVRPLSDSETDRRDITNWFSYSDWQAQRLNATVAYTKLLQYGNGARAGEMLAMRGYATVRLAAMFCPGFPITELNGFAVVLGRPVTTGQAFERALADFDPALTLAADSARVLNFVRIGRGEALLGLGRFSDAAAAVADVPSGYVWVARFDATSRNPVALSDGFNPNASQVTTVAEREGGNGLDFVSSNDPRIKLRQYGTVLPPKGDGEPLYESGKYANGSASVVVASGIEARLIEAEAALVGGNATWLSILNNLRATQISPALPALEDPGTPVARQDLIFRERAFWLYATGQRLPDVLRLVRLYGRDPESVFPTGEYHQHGYFYGTATSLPFDPQLEAGNPAVTGCTGI